LALEQHLTSLGLSQAPATRDIEVAISQANTLLNAGQSKIQLKLASDAVLAELDVGNTVPVAWVTPPANGTIPMAYVPDGVRGIVLDSRSLQGFLRRYAIRREPLYWGDRPLKVGEPDELLALILLHEAGHVSLGHAGSFNSHSRDARTHTNALKQLELEADGFAADKIRTALSSTDEEARRVAAGLWELTSRFSAQQAMERMSRHPPTRTVGPFTRAANPNATRFGDRRIVFGDGAATHPNLELRMLVIAYRIDPTAEADRLRTFLKARGDTALLGLLGLADSHPVQGEPQ